MINVLAGARVILAIKPIDFRNYAEFTIMQSPRRRCVLRRGVDAVQHREKLVRFPKASWFEHRRRGRSESFELFGWVSSQVDLGALEAGMAEPERDLADVPCRLEGVHRTGVSKNVWCHSFFADGRLLTGSCYYVFGKDVF
jgi:hypothetical protein